jgi:hypothetical protein
MIHVQQSDAFITPHRIEREIDPASDNGSAEHDDKQQESDSQSEASDS